MIRGKFDRTSGTWTAKGYRCGRQLACGVYVFKLASNGLSVQAIADTQSRADCEPNSDLVDIPVNHQPPTPGATLEC